jgi:hypothetical protein
MLSVAADNEGMRTSLQRSLIGVATVALAIRNRHLFCKHNMHMLRTAENERGFYYWCPLCGFSIEGGMHVNGKMEATDG